MFWPTGSCRHERHAPETTLLYQLLERHWPEFKAMLSAQGKQLPGYVVREFDDYLKCGRLEYGFLRVRCDTCHHEKLERLCRYIARPAIAERRLSLANNGNVVIALKTPYDDGTTHVVLSPMEFMGRLAALVSRPRMNVTRFHGVFSPNSKLREYVVSQHPVEEPENPKPKAYSMTWAQRLKRVFAIEIEKCEKCGGLVRIIALIEDPDVIQKILKHLGLDQTEDSRNRTPPADLTDQQTTLF